MHSVEEGVLEIVVFVEGVVVVVVFSGSSPFLQEEDFPSFVPHQWDISDD